MAFGCLLGAALFYVIYRADPKIPGAANRIFRGTAIFGAGATVVFAVVGIITWLRQVF